MDVEDFIRRWSEAPISERAHYQTFISQLCRLIGVAAPDEDRAGDRDYCFERPVRFLHEDGSSHPGYIDCYRRGSFVLEAKQSRKREAGGALDPQPQLALYGARHRREGGPRPQTLQTLMRNAKRQAEAYAKALDEWPPFLVVVDVGCAIEVWSDFARQGKAYVPFPDRARYRIEMADLRDPEVRDRLRRIWLEPMSLDPAQRVAKVTTEIAGHLAWLVRSIGSRVPLGTDGRPDPVAKAARANQTALFVMQCIFAMFADSVKLIEDNGFRRFLESYRGHAAQFHLGASDFFRRMDQGGHCSAIHQTLRRFNGGLFQHVAALPITEEELEALIAAAKRDWASVEPAIFGSLLEQALHPEERSELGAHYTPRAFVERLVEPVIMEPLRADWEAVEASAIGLYMAGEEKQARGLIKAFHRDLCRTRVLDPACGTGNFLYVAMGMMKELEGEVLAVLSELGERQTSLALDGHTVSPEQFWGLEKNTYAVWIAEMVMWIGYLQWHFRVYGDAQPSEPILRNFHRIRKADALLTFAREELVRDAEGRVMAQDFGLQGGAGTPSREVVRLINPRPTPWPDVHFIIGNPPFIGGKDLRRALGDGYVDALWQVRQGRFRSADLVTAWWDRAAEILTAPGSSLRRFGFITTNSISQTLSRRVLEHHLNGRPPIRLVFAVPDHPWIKGGERAQVRIAMSVAERGEADGQGRHLRVLSEDNLDTDTPVIQYEERRGVIGADLELAGGSLEAGPLLANAHMAMRGVQLMGQGFVLGPEEADRLKVGNDPASRGRIKPYCNGRDLAGRSRKVEVIDLYGLDEEEARRQHPALFQHLLERVKPERERNRRASYRRSWWIFGEPRRELRTALQGLERYIVTVETAKHRWFRFLEPDVLPDNKLVVIASDSAAVLGVLSSRIHHLWFAANAGRIGVYDEEAVYVKGRCFDTFPFPDLEGEKGRLVAALALEIDDLRRRVIEQNPDLTMTILYNARDLIAAGGPRTELQKSIHSLGCIGLLDHLHHKLDRAVLAAYGWSPDLTDAEVVERLVELNRQRRLEEARGQLRFLRPGFQQPRVQMGEPAISMALEPVGLDQRHELPSAPGALALTLLQALRSEGGPVGPKALAGRFKVAGSSRRIERQISQTLAVLAVAGTVQKTEAGWFTPRRP